MVDFEEQRINEKDIKDSKLIEIDALLEVCGPICRIITKTILGSGFFIKFEKANKPLYCLLTCEHVIPEKIINSNEVIEIYYANQKIKLKICLNEEERFIRCYKYINIDATLIEILPKDNVEEKYFLLPNLDYINGYEQFIDQEIYIPQFPGQKSLSFSSGKIKSFNIYSYDFSHLASTRPGSSGSPIFLTGSLLVLGIHKQSKTKKEENYGDFLGPIVNSLKNDFPILIKNTDTIEYKIESDGINGRGMALFKNNDNYYLGEFKGFIMQGKGIIYTKNKKKVYEGNFVNDKYEGQGKLIFNDKYYIGNFIDGKIHGKGTLFSKNGNVIYEGDFEFGNYDGYGTLYEKNGEYYKGQFINNQKHGKGILYSNDNKVIYEGEFAFDTFEGNGKFYFDDGYYIGQFMNGQYNGKGIIFNSDNTIRYDGDFENSNFDGYGIYYNKNDTYYKGFFKNNLFHGKGTEFTMENKIIYDGEYILGKYEGKGRLNYKDGSYYIGDFLKAYVMEKEFGIIQILLNIMMGISNSINLKEMVLYIRKIKKFILGILKKIKNVEKGYYFILTI